MPILLKSILTALRIAWPGLLFLGIVALVYVAVGLWRQRRIARSGIEEIDRMTGLQFEQYLEWLFCQLGYRVSRTSYQGDYGADLVATKDGVKTAVQAKRSKRRIGIKAVQQAFASTGRYACQQSMVVTNASFTPQAIELARADNVELWDRNRLRKAMDSVGGKRAIAQAIAPEEPTTSQPAMFSVGAQTSGSAEGATCAVCGQRVSEKVRDYCLANERRFAGQILCYKHQRTR